MGNSWKKCEVINDIQTTEVNSNQLFWNSTFLMIKLSLKNWLYNTSRFTIKKVNDSRFSVDLKILQSKLLTHSYKNLQSHGSFYLEIEKYFTVNKP